MNANDLITQVKDLPPVPVAAVRLLGLLNQPTLDNEDLVKVVKYDTALTARMLRVCNSAHYGLAEPVCSVEQAVLLLGQREISRIVMALSFGPSLSRKLPNYAVEGSELWHHSLACALAAEHICNQDIAGAAEPSLAFTAGLLHDIGKMALNQFITADTVVSIRNLVKNNSVSRVEAERQILGVDHAQMGGALLGRWNLPEIIIEAVTNHHNPILQPKVQLSAIMHVANCEAHLLGCAIGWDGYAERAREDVMEALGLEAEALQQEIIAVHESLSAINEFMKG
jgi:putative nucleotidyltransferase with HDIG domain